MRRTSARRRGRSFLRRSGYDALGAANGDDAILVANDHPSTIDLLLMMPRMSGRKVTVRRPLIIDRFFSVIPAYFDEEKAVEGASKDGPTRWSIAAQMSSELSESHGRLLVRRRRRHEPLRLEPKNRDLLRRQRRARTGGVSAGSAAKSE